MITILPLPFLRNHGKILIFGSGKIFKGAKPTSVIDQRLRRTLVDSLYSNPMSLLIGALCGVLVCAYTAYVSDDEALQIVAWVLAGVALTRVAVMVAVRNVLRAKSSTLELLFEFGAFAYAGSVSLMADRGVVHMPGRTLNGIGDWGLPRLKRTHIGAWEAFDVVPVRERPMQNTLERVLRSATKLGITLR